MTNRVTCAPPVLVAAALLATGGCGGDERPSGLPAFAEWEVNGGFRMGDLDHPDYAFGEVGAIAVGADGSLFTAHPRERRIRVWTERAEPVRIIGGPGDGPGEFTALGQIGFSDGNLWAMDSRAYRVTWFAPGGEVLQTVPLSVDTRAPRSDPAMGRPFPTHALGDGTYFGRQSGVLPQMVDRDSTLLRMLHLDDHASVLHTLLEHPFRSRDGMAVPRPGGEGWLYGYQPFSDQPLTAVDPSLGALLVVDRSAHTGIGPAVYRLTTLSMTGDTLLHRELMYEPQPIGSDVVERVVDALTRQWKGQAPAGVDENVLAGLAREALYVPEYYPPISAAALGMDGSIWLRSAHSETARIPWMIFDSEGQPLARVSLSTSFQPRAVKRDVAWGVSTDNQGVPYVVRYDVGPPESG